MRIIYKLIFTTLIITFISGCTSSKDDEILKIGRCHKAAQTLDDLFLKDATEFRMQSSLKDHHGSTRDAMVIGEKLQNEIQPQGSSTPFEYSIKIANSWKNTDYCKEVENNFSKYIEDLVSQRLKLADSNSNPLSCNDLKIDSTLAYKNRHTKKYQKDFDARLIKSVDEMANNLKAHHAVYIKKELLKSDYKNIIIEISEKCIADEPAINSLKKLNILKELESPTTKKIRDSINSHENMNDCGAIPEVYCKSRIMLASAKNAYKFSSACDIDYSNNDSCQDDADGFVYKEFYEAQKKLLTTAKQKYENYIKDPKKYDHNTDGNVYLIAEKCKGEAISKGLRGDAYQAYSKNVCQPRAMEEFLKPKVDILQKINDELAENPNK